jgi:hypothetical protein
MIFGQEPLTWIYVFSFAFSNLLRYTMDISAIIYKQVVQILYVSHRLSHARIQMSYATI